MKIERNEYLNKLIELMQSPSIKVITGIRRSGKSYLLRVIFKEYLIKQGIKEDHIIYIALDDIKNDEFLDGVKLYHHITDLITDDDKYFIMLDEIQKVERFVAVTNGLNQIDNTDLYITGSNSKFLSSDILTEFRGRSLEIRVRPLSFREYFKAVGGDKNETYNEYAKYGGMPEILSIQNPDTKIEYLKSLINTTYLKDIIERNHLKSTNEMDELFDYVCSVIGSLTNPLNISNTLKSKKNKKISDDTVKKYLDYLEDAFMIEQANRYDIKGKSYFNSTKKYYLSDIGLRNARLGFRQYDFGAVMENIIYNELRLRGFQVDVGIVKAKEKQNGKRTTVHFEVDFVAMKSEKKYYIQSAYRMDHSEKEMQEKKSLTNISDSFKKIIITRDDVYPTVDEQGIATIGLLPFLLDENSLDL